MYAAIKVYSEISDWRKIMHENEAHKIVVFKDKNIRRTLHQNEWWFSVIDVVGALSESNNPRRYWSDLKGNLLKKRSSFNCTKKSYS